MDQLRIAVAQINPVAGDILRNLDLHIAAYEEAAENADLVVFSEASLTGYPIGDLALHEQFLMDCMAANDKLVERTKGEGRPGILFGSIVVDETVDPAFYAYASKHRRMKGKTFNAAIMAENGEVIGKRYKRSLPTFGPFDEARWFEPGPLQGPVMFRGAKIGLQICDDAWREDGPETLEETGADMMIALNGFRLHRRHHGPAPCGHESAESRSRLSHHLHQPCGWTGRDGVRRRGLLHQSRRRFCRLLSAGRNWGFQHALDAG